MSRKYILLIMLISMPAILYAHDSNKPPALGSWFKTLDKSSGACKIQSSFVLQKIGVKNLVENDYGVYGNYKNNRVVVKCLDKNDKSILWVAVAGKDGDSVELLRNEIVKEIN